MAQVTFRSVYIISYSYIIYIKFSFVCDNLTSAVKQNMIFSHMWQFTIYMQGGHHHEDHAGNLGCGMGGSGVFAPGKY